MNKRILLFSAIFTAGAVTAQFTPENAPMIGDSIQLYVVDSTASNLKEVSGDGVTWDYSNLIDYEEETRKIRVVTTEDTPFASTFDESDKAIELAGEFITFVTDDADERISQGIVFKDAELGDLVLNLNTQAGTYYSYPFDLGDSIFGEIEGTASFEYQGNTINTTASGTYYSKVDGRGTLKTGVVTEYTNVLRYHIIDTIEIEVPIPGIPNYVAIHEQFEYYDFTVSNLPIFVHASLWFGQENTQNPRNDFSLVLSIDTKTSSISTEELLSTNIYPNPANGFVNIELPNEVVKADISIVDATGRIVLNTSVENNSTQVDVSALDMGTYFVRISADDKFATKTLIIK